MLLQLYSFPDKSSWIPSPYFIVWNILGYHTTCTNYGIFTNSHSITYHSISTNKTIVTQLNDTLLESNTRLLSK